MKISKRVRLLAVIGGSGIVVASSACAVDSTAPTPVPPAVVSVTPEARSGFAPRDLSPALIGVVDGTYTVTFNPAVNQVFALGPNRLEMPANSVCRLGTSGYGPAYWNRPCTPESRPVTLRVTVNNASSDKPQVDFQPAMRFNPQTKVSLYFYVPNVKPSDRKAWVIQYCADGSGSGVSGKCVDESLTDLSLRTYIDYNTNVLFRRVKHFSRFRVDDSGYVVGG